MIREVFEYPAGGQDVSVQLLYLWQDTELAGEYAIKYCTLGNKPATHNMFTRFLFTVTY